MEQILFAIGCFAVVSTIFSAPSNAQTRANSTQPAIRSNPVEFESLINRYFDSLNETDAARRRELIERVWAKDGKFVSPVGEAVGHDEIDRQIGGFQKQFPGATVRRTSSIDRIGDNFRFAFEAVEQGGKAFIGGVDFAIIENGKLKSMTGFFDFAPNQPAPTGKTESPIARRHIETIGRIYEAFNLGDYPKILESFASTIEWIAAENSPLADKSPYRGLTAVRDGVFARIAVGLPKLQIKADELFAAGENKVVMLGYYDGVFKATGKPIHAQVAHVWTFSGGKVVKFQQYADTYQLAKSAK